MLEAEQGLKELMLRSLGGDAEAYRLLLSRLSSLLRSFYRNRLRNNSADVEDLVQETLMAIHTRRLSFDRTQPLTPWVYAIARYKLCDHFRRSGRNTAVDITDSDDGAGADDFARFTASHDVERLLAALPGPTSEAIRLTKLEGRSVEEAARRVGKSVTATKVTIHRGMLKLIRGRRGKGGDADE